jgi:hypothetical protein
VNGDDAQTLRDVTYFAGELLKLADVLPADLTAMLRDYHSELRTAPRWRWDGIGGPSLSQLRTDLIRKYCCNRI